MCGCEAVAGRGKQRRVVEHDLRVVVIVLEVLVELVKRVRAKQ